MDALFVLLSFGVFAVCVLLVLLTGAQTYRAQTDRDQESWNRRTGVQYVAAKVRHADEAGTISFSDGDGGLWYETLNLKEIYGEEEYVTAIYYYDGYIRELFAVKGGVYAPEDGEPVLKAQGLRFGWDGELVQVEATDANGHITRLVLSPRCQGVGA